MATFDFFNFEPDADDEETGAACVVFAGAGLCVAVIRELDDTEGGPRLDSDRESLACHDGGSCLGFFAAGAAV